MRYSFVKVVTQSEGELPLIWHILVSIFLMAIPVAIVLALTAVGVASGW